MENTTSVKVAINNPADIVVIVGYFITIIGVGIWVRWAKNDFYMQETWKAQVGEGIMTLCFNLCLEPS